MRKSLSVLSVILAWLLAAFFFYGAYANWFISPEYAASYIAWGYPGWFHYITAVLELAGALMLLRAAWRPFGAALLALVMIAALLSTLLNAAYSESPPPAIALLIALIVLTLSWTLRPPVK